MGQTAWAVELPRESSLAAGALRLRGDVRVRDGGGDTIWLRGVAYSEEIDLELRKLPGGRRHTVDAAGRYTEVGRRVPDGTLPADGWVALSAWLAPAPQPAALPGELPPRAALRVERSCAERPASVLLTTASDWADWAAAAPAVRLRPLQFAACDDGRTVVRGTPLPPRPGRRFFERDGVAVPCGFGLSPSLDPAVLRDLLALAPGDLALFADDGSYEHVAADAFVRATRAAARASREGVRP